MDPTGDDPARARAARRSSGACRRDSGTNTLVHWPEGESSPYHVQHQAKRRRIHTVPDPELFAIGQNQFQRRRAGHRFQKSELHRCALLQPLAPIVKGMIADALFLAERPNGLAAGLLLGDQVAPILALSVGHPPKMPHLRPAAEGWIIGRLPLRMLFLAGPVAACAAWIFCDREFAMP